MKKTSSSHKTDRFPALRRRAEEKLRTQLERLQQFSTPDIQELAHELGTHQIELEMQNEELRKAQGELESSRNQYADLYDFAPVGYFTLDAQGQILGVNLTGSNLLGIERCSLLKKHLINFIPLAAEREIFLQHREEVVLRQGAHTCELRLKRKDGAAFFALLQSSAEETAGVKTGNIRTTIVDVTERRKTDDAIKFQVDVLSQVSDAVIALDNDLRILYWNSAAERLYDCKAAEVIGGHVKEAYDNKWINAGDEREAYDSLKATGAWRGENIHIKKNGDTIYVLSSVSVLKNRSGEPIGMLAVMRDITLRREMELALHQAHEVLEQTVRDRTKELLRTNEQLTVVFCINPAQSS